MTLLGTFGHLQRLWKRTPSRRSRAHQSGNWTNTELLETRALLCAAPAAAAAEMAIEQARAAVEFPQIAGTWNLTLTGEETPSASVNIQQDGKKITATVNSTLFPEVVLKDKFSKKSPYELSSTVKYRDPEVGKVTVRLEITLPQGQTEPMTFTARVNVQSLDLEYQGEKLVWTATAPKGSRAAPVFPDVAGVYSVLLIDPQSTTEAMLELTQSGKGGKIVSGTIDVSIDDEGFQIILKGKFNKSAPDTVKGKLLLRGADVSGKPAFILTFNEALDAFTADVFIKREQAGSIEGTRTFG